jgi:hypothetical protein
MGWKMGSFVKQGFRQGDIGGERGAIRRTSESVVSAVIIYSSTYTGRVAHLVAQMRSAKIQNRVFE